MDQENGFSFSCRSQSLAGRPLTFKVSVLFTDISLLQAASCIEVHCELGLLGVLSQPRPIAQPHPTISH